jgi:hypothetical protein
VPVARGQRTGALSVAHDALDQERREPSHVEHGLVVVVATDTQFGAIIPRGSSSV